MCTKGRDVISTTWWLALTGNSSFITRRIADYPTFSGKVRNSVNASVQRACSPEHRRAWQTCYCLKLPCVKHTKSLSKAIKQESYLTQFSRLRSLSSTELTRQITPPTKNGHCTTTHRIKKELSICQSLQCLDLVSFPVLSQIKPQAPLLVVPFRQFL